MKNYKNILKVIYFLFHFLIVVIASIILLDSFYNIFDSLDNKHNYYVAIIILVTSIATSSFFLIKIYIENQLGIKEKDMIKEYQDFVNNKIQEQTEQQNLKFEQQNIKFDNLANNQINLTNSQQNLIKDVNKAFEKISKDIEQLKDSKK